MGGVQPGEDGPLRAGDEGEGRRAPEAVPEAPGGQGSDGYGGEGLRPWAHEVREGGCRQGGALSSSSAPEQRTIFSVLECASFLSGPRRGGRFSLTLSQCFHDFHKVECFLPFVFETAKRTDIERS